MHMHMHMHMHIHVYVYVRNIKTEHVFLVGKTEDKEYYLRFKRR